MPTAEEIATAPLLDGRYQLGACIGQGGAAKVYRADDLLLGRTVAVKLMQGDVGALAAPSRVRTEVSVLASLTHPSLVELYDARIEPGRPSYLVMEYVEGPTLARRLHDGPLTVAECAALGCDLASALHTVHEAGIVHRDIKPANVLLAPAVLPGSGFRAKLADFGVALLVDTTRVTAAGTVVGTAAYLPPEQIRGDAATPPGDIYALGLVLIEALTGERGFPQATGIGAVMARLFDSPQVPKQFGEGWADLLTRMTAPEPADRPPAAEVSHTIARLAAALPGDLAGRPELVPPDQAAAQTQPLAAPTEPAPEIASAILPLPLVATPPASPVTGPTVEFAVSGEDLVAPSAAASTPRRRSSGALVAAVAALAAALCILLAFWAAGATGAAAPQKRLSSEPFVRVAPAPDAGTGDPVVEDAVVEDTGPQAPVTEPVDDEAAEKAAEKAEEEAQREAEKQAEAEQRAQEKADREAEKAREQAERDAEKNGKDG